VPDGPRAVVFDLDGTLVDTAADIHAVLAEVMAEAGLAAPGLPAVRGMIGDGARVLVERALAAVGLAAGSGPADRLHRRFGARYAEVPCRHSAPYPGARELLDRLRADDWRTGLCTNKPHAATLGLLRALDLEDRLDAVVGGDRLPGGVRKPDPGHLAAVLAELDVPAARAVMVGDSRNDLLTARALGVPCVLVGYGYTAVPAGELGADTVIGALAELPTALPRLRRPPPPPRPRP
jgi:phosphoglycolate phosphatase